MDIQLEQQIVRLFFNASHQERIIYELGNVKKRNRALHRLCHNYTNILKPQVMNAIVSSDALKTSRIVRQYGGDTINCYVLSYNWDGIFLPLEDALKEVVGNGMAAIIYCGNKTAYFEAEQEQGSPPRFILKA